jgi:hypothetical protein
MIRLSIDVIKISKERLYPGKNGAKYLNAVLIENRNGVDQWGNAGMIVEDVTQDERQAGKKGVIIGNYKNLGGASGGGQPRPAAQRPQQQPARRPAPAPAPPGRTAPVIDPEDDIPF